MLAILTDWNVNMPSNCGPTEKWESWQAGQLGTGLSGATLARIENLAETSGIVQRETVRPGKEKTPAPVARLIAGSLAVLVPLALPLPSARVAL